MMNYYDELIKFNKFEIKESNYDLLDQINQDQIDCVWK